MLCYVHYKLIFSIYIDLYWNNENAQEIWFPFDHSGAMIACHECHNLMYNVSSNGSWDKKVLLSSSYQPLLIDREKLCPVPRCLVDSHDFDKKLGY